MKMQNKLGAAGEHSALRDYLEDCPVSAHAASAVRGRTSTIACYRASSRLGRLHPSKGGLTATA